MKLRYKNFARVDLQSFINHYEAAFRELYRDSGLWNEASIIEGYERSAAVLYDAISNAVETRLAKQKVLGRKPLSQGWYEIDLKVGGRLVVVYYSDDKNANVRWIESITIDKKPIIF